MSGRRFEQPEPEFRCTEESRAELDKAIQWLGYDSKAEWLKRLDSAIQPAPAPDENAELTESVTPPEPLPTVNNAHPGLITEDLIPESLKDHVSIHESSESHTTLAIQNLWLARSLEGKLSNPSAPDAYSLADNGLPPYGLKVTNNTLDAVLTAMKNAEQNPGNTLNVQLVASGRCHSNAQRREHTQNNGVPNTGDIVALDSESTRLLMGAANAASKGLVTGSQHDIFNQMIDAVPMAHASASELMEAYLFSNMNETAFQLNRVFKGDVYRQVVYQFVEDLKQKFAQLPDVQTIGELLPGGPANAFDIQADGVVVDTVFLPEILADLPANEYNINHLLDCLLEATNVSLSPDPVFMGEPLEQALDEWHGNEPRLTADQGQLLGIIREHMQTGHGVLQGADGSLFKYDPESKTLDIVTSPKIGGNKKNRVELAKAGQLFSSLKQRERSVHKNLWVNLVKRQADWFDSAVYFGAWPTALIKRLVENNGTFFNKALIQFLKTEEEYEGIPESTHFALWQWKANAGVANKLISGIVDNTTVEAAQAEIEAIKQAWEQGTQQANLPDAIIQDSYAYSRYQQELAVLSENLVIAKTNLDKALAISVTGEPPSAAEPAARFACSGD